MIPAHKSPPLKSFSELPKIPAVTKMTKPRKKQSSQFLEPVYINKLVAHYNSQKVVAEKLMVNGGLISNAVSKNNVRAVNEVAAKAIWFSEVDKREVSIDGDVIFTARISKDAFRAISDWMKEAGAIVKVFG